MAAHSCSSSLRRPRKVFCRISLDKAGEPISARQEEQEAARGAITWKVFIWFSVKSPSEVFQKLEGLMS